MGMRKTKQRRARRSKARALKANKDTFNTKVISEFVAIPGQGGLVANYYYWTQPMWNNANQVDITKNSMFLFYCMQYDRWRINSITIKCKPKANVMDATLAQQDGNYNLVGDGLVHTVIDRDGNAPQNVSALSRYSSYKAFSVLKPWSRTMSVKYPKDTWLDCQKLQTNDNAFDLRNNIGLAGTITVYAENFIEDNYEIFNEPWATFIVEYNVSFQGRTGSAVAVSVDEDGNPTQIVLKPHPVEVDKPVCAPKNVKGTLAPTVSVNEITEEPDEPVVA